MEKELKEARKIFNRVTNGSPEKELIFDLDVHKKLLNLFQVGSYYYYIFNLRRSEFDLVSPEIEDVLGYKPDEINLAQMMNSIHPEDLPWFLNFENKIVSFFTALRTDQLLKYKVRYEFRIRKSNGEYIRVLQQVVTIEYDEKSGGLLRTFGIHTDITYLKKEGKPILSLIGMEGEPSYIDVDVDKLFAPSTRFSFRKENVKCLTCLGKGNKVKA